MNRHTRAAFERIDAGQIDGAHRTTRGAHVPIGRIRIRGPKLIAIVTAGGARFNFGNAPDTDPLEGTYIGFPNANERWVRIPYDGGSPTFFTDAAISALAFDWTALPLDVGTDDRKNALYARISELTGPVFHLIRA